MATATKTRGGKRANNKSAAIRDYMAAHPEAGPTAVTAALKAKGIAISPAHVSNVKAALAKKAKKAASSTSANGHARRKPGRPGRPVSAVTDTVSLSQLVEARDFAAHVGGVDQAVALLQTLAKLR